MALDLGYRHVDTAQAYGNESAVGEGIAASNVHRKDIFLTTKVWRSNLRYADVLQSVKQSLDRLSVEYIALLLIHSPHPLRSLTRTLEAMTELQANGDIRHLGVANFTRSQLKSALRITDDRLVTNQVLYHPLKDRSPLRTLCVKNGLTLTAYSPLARRALPGEPWLAELCSRYGKSAPQVALRSLMQEDGVIAIPNPSSREPLEDNSALFDFELTTEEMERVFDLGGGLVARLRTLLGL
jgi:diketogulonate reductase-like aldo/keto reductase